jgi:hypothetical protein
MYKTKIPRPRNDLVSPGNGMIGFSSSEIQPIYRISSAFLNHETRLKQDYLYKDRQHPEGLGRKPRCDFLRVPTALAHGKRWSGDSSELSWIAKRCWGDEKQVLIIVNNES